MLLKQASKWLGWPNSSQVLNPKGEGARACVRLAKLKIGASLQRSFPSLSIETGILTPDPNGNSTATPFAVVCQFSTGASNEALQEAHRLAWNFSQTAVLVTLEPHRLMAWSCLQDPNQNESMRRVCEFSGQDSSKKGDPNEQERIRELLHWVSLVTGHLQKQMPSHFPSDGRADTLLLKNLRYVRKELLSQGLDRTFCHDLLARIIFTQFLFHRKDSSGKPFFSNTLLGKRCDGELQHVYSDLPSILRNKEDTYALFRWMDARFNGDLFPGTADQSDDEREQAWQAEKDAVQDEHLQLLADLISGQIDTQDRQLLLWPQYSFDTIPLEFISSVYEEFLNEDRDANKAYYTRPQLVDYVLDAVLPWHGTDWDLNILDPACGSGIFLVKAFQRLIHRWRQAHDREPLVRDLKALLASSFRGVDINPDAVRVACFSLYLAMADAIDPKHYVTREKVFPRLRGTQLVQADFFDDSLGNLLTDGGASAFDLVIGNAPWGDKSTKQTSEKVEVDIPACGRRKAKTLQTTNAENWARINDWPITNNDIGPLFVARGLDLLKDTGRLAMLQPAPPWLYQRGNPALKLREKLFHSYTVDEITNLSALRHEMFADVIGPSCVLVVGRDKPKPDTDLYYFTPKPIRSADGTAHFSIEPQDVNRITHHEAATDPMVWPVLSLGGRRDLQLIRQLRKLPSLAKLKEKKVVHTRLGVIPGDRKKELPALKHKPYLEETNFPEDVFLELDGSKVPSWENPKVHSKDSADFSAFKKPQLLIKQSFVTKLGRFRAAIVRSDDPEWGVICKQTYLTVRDTDSEKRHIHKACIAYNSFLAAYFLFLTSSRLGHYITEVKSNELLDVPLPNVKKALGEIGSFKAIDQAVRKALALTDADNAIIDDILNIRLPDALRQTPGPGRKQTRRIVSKKTNEPELSTFADTFIRVLQQTFGPDMAVSATVFQEPESTTLLPVRVVTFHIGEKQEIPIRVEAISATGLLDNLASFHRDVLSKRVRSATGDGLGFQRVAFLFHRSKGESGTVQNLTIVKPDEYRYWTRSRAMRDADDLSAAIFQAAKGRK
jgi:type I restriction-modification system DNA methylase subunit